MAKSKALRELENVCAEWLENKRALDPLAKTDEQLKVKVRRLTAACRVEELETEGKTSYVAGVKVTRTDAPVPKVVPAKLLERLGSDVFLEVVVIKDLDLDMERWHALLKEELVTEQDLTDCLGPDPAPKAWSVAVA